MKRLPPGLEIRSFRMADYPATVEVWESCGVGIDSREQVRSMLRRNPGLIIVAEVKQRVVGVIIGSWDGRRGSLWRLAVHPDYQRRGVAQKLMSEIEKRLRQKGATWVYLMAYTENQPAINLYKALGYDVAKEVMIIHKSLSSD